MDNKKISSFKETASAKWGQVYNYVKLNQEELKSSWNCLHHCAKSAGSITTESKPMKYLDVAFEIKSHVQNLRTNLKTHATIKKMVGWKYFSVNNAKLAREYVEYARSELSNLISPIQWRHNIPEEEQDYLLEVNGIQLIFSEYSKTITEFGIPMIGRVMYNETGQSDQAADMILEWQRNRIGKYTAISIVDKNLNIEEDKHFTWIPTKLGETIAQEIKDYAVKGYGRTYMLYGPPGTGKSNLAKNICGSLEGRVLIFINIADLFSAGVISYSFDKLVKNLDVKTVVIDDLDHLDGNNIAFTLKQLEILRASGKTVICSVNQIKKLDPAIIRPGRFDKIIEIKYMPENKILEMVNQDTELFELVKTWPVVSIKELMIRVDVKGKAKALEEIDDLKRRVEVLTETDYDL